MYSSHLTQVREARDNPLNLAFISFDCLPATHGPIMTNLQDSTSKLNTMHNHQ